MADRRHKGKGKGRDTTEFGYSPRMPPDTQTQEERWFPRPPPAPLTQPAGAATSHLQLTPHGNHQTLSQIIGTNLDSILAHAPSVYRTPTARMRPASVLSPSTPMSRLERRKRHCTTARVRSQSSPPALDRRLPITSTGANSQLGPSADYDEDAIEGVQEPRPQVLFRGITNELRNTQPDTGRDLRTMLAAMDLDEEEPNPFASHTPPESSHHQSRPLTPQPHHTSPQPHISPRMSPSNRAPARRIGGRRYSNAHHATGASRPNPNATRAEPTQTEPARAEPARAEPATALQVGNAQNRPSRQQHPTANKLWCKRKKHWVDATTFGECATCAGCLASAAETRRRTRQRRQAAANAEDVNRHDEPPPPQNQRPVTPPLSSNHDPLQDPAITQEDRNLLLTARQKLMDIQMEYCESCHEKWFDLQIIAGKCKHCRANTGSEKFTEDNQMYPGPDLQDLPELTQVEEMLIAPVHALVQVWQVRGGQFKYTGHTCNFPRDTISFHKKLPLLPEECDVIIVRRRGADIMENNEVFQDFRVRRHAIRQWLDYLANNHPTFRDGSVTIDAGRLSRLPEDGLVHTRMRSLETEDLEAPADEGPPEGQDQQQQPDLQQPLFS